MDDLRMKDVEFDEQGDIIFDDWFDHDQRELDYDDYRF